MKKINKIFLYLFGLILSLGYSKANIFAQVSPMDSWYGVEAETVPLYGVESSPVPAFFNKVLTIILSPIFFVFLITSALIIGAYVLAKRKRNLKKDIKKNEK